MDITDMHDDSVEVGSLGDENSEKFPTIEITKLNGPNETVKHFISKFSYDDAASTPQPPGSNSSIVIKSIRHVTVFPDYREVNRTMSTVYPYYIAKFTTENSTNNAENFTKSMFYNLSL